MFDAESTARLRTVFDEVCAGVSRYETAVRVYVASKMLEAATNGEISTDGLRKVGLRALIDFRENDATS
jgi:hypothetical protein